MARMFKAGSLRMKAADAKADITLINQYSVKELTPEDVFCFSVVMCDNNVDREMEVFTDKSLEDLAPLFVGKPVISDHRWSSNGQIGRIYATEVQVTKEKNQLGKPLKQIVGKVYMLNTEENKATIDAIEGGILKEVSVGFLAKELNCSLCGKEIRWNRSSWTEECENHHQKGETYPGEGLCYGLMENITDAYELSFVAVPAQRNAGVRKQLESLDGAFEDLLSCPDLSEHPRFDELVKHIQQSTMARVDREARKKILERNEKILKLYEKEN